MVRRTKSTRLWRNKRRKKKKKREQELQANLKVVQLGMFPRQPGIRNKRRAVNFTISFLVIGHQKCFLSHRDKYGYKNGNPVLFLCSMTNVNRHRCGIFHLSILRTKSFSFRNKEPAYMTALNSFQLNHWRTNLRKNRDSSQAHRRFLGSIGWNFAG